MLEETELKRYLIRIEMVGVHLPIWREVVIPSDVSLGELSEVIQVAIGWEDEHLHMFLKDGVRFEPMDLVSEESAENSEDDYDLDDLLENVGDSMRYVYDFGDDWMHTVTLKKILPWDDSEIFVCTAGSGTGPLENCGGPMGYQDLCLSGQVKNPEVFDLKAANEGLLDLLSLLQEEATLEDELFDDDFGEDSETDEALEISHPYLDLSDDDKWLFKRLFEAGELVRAAEPWKDLWDQDIFGIKDPDTGLLDIVSVLGRGGEVFSIHVHTAPECYEYWRMAKDGTLQMDSAKVLLRKIRMVELEFTNKEALDSEDVDLYSEVGYKAPSKGAQKWMRVRRYHPRSVPYFPSTDLLPNLIRGARLAVRFVAAVRAEPNRAQSKYKLSHVERGLPKELPVYTIASNRHVSDWAAWELGIEPMDWYPADFPDGSYEPSEFEQERVGSYPKGAGIWEVGAIYGDTPFATESGPVIPIIAMVAPIVVEGTVPQPYISSGLEESAGFCVWRAFADIVHQRGCFPEQLNVTSDIAEKTFRLFANHTGMKVKRVQQTEVVQDFFSFMQGRM
ncbi:MAG: plasmid pRiA4b ORF-3 family protein [Opitutaceae bacterium]